MVFFAGLVLVFTLIYASPDLYSLWVHSSPGVQPRSATTIVADAALRALDISLVVGYTSHSTAEGWWPAVQMLNLLGGLYWYSLAIPLIYTRTVR